MHEPPLQASSSPGMRIPKTKQWSKRVPGRFCIHCYFIHRVISVRSWSFTNEPETGSLSLSCLSVRTWPLLNKLLKQEVLIWHVCLSEHDLFWINYWNRKSQFNSHLSEMSVTLMQSLYRCMWQNIESSKRSFSYQYHFLLWTLKKVTTKFPTQ